MGKLIVIEGLDGSGKSTQLARLPAALKTRGIGCMSVSFPDYESDSSALIRMYLNGDFGSRPGDVNAYTASMFYAADRFASYRRRWGQYYDDGGTVIAGRYTTSNAVHQCSKLPREEWPGFLDWLYDFEYCKIGLPKPDCVIFLDMPLAVSQRLLAERYGGDRSRRDIHERDVAYLAACREAAAFTAEYSGWRTVCCAENDAPRTVEAVGEDILDIVMKLF